MHLPGYKGEGTSTTPLDVCVIKDLDLFNLVSDVIDRLPKLGPQSAKAKQAVRDAGFRSKEGAIRVTHPQVPLYFSRAKPAMSARSCSAARINSIARSARRQPSIRSGPNLRRIFQRSAARSSGSSSADLATSSISPRTRTSFAQPTAS